MSTTTDYNKARLANPGLSFTEFKTGQSAPPSTVSTPAPEPANTIQRNPAQEQASLSKLGISEVQALQLSENPAFQKKLFEMTYGDNANQISEYQQLSQATEEREGLAGQLGDIRQNAPNAMLALEDALRTKQDPGQQQLGESELYAKAGLEGYNVLNQSLGEQSRLMEDRYGSFINALSRAGQYQTNQYNALAGQYKTLTDQYNTEAEQMNDTLNQIQEYNQAMDLIDRELEIFKDKEKFKESLDDGIPSIAPSGNVATATLGGQNVRLDTVALNSLSGLESQLADMGGLRIAGGEYSSFRTPEQQKVLYDRYLAGGSVASPPGQSAHETGMAIDLVPDTEYINKVKPILEANGWEQNAAHRGDYVHFEYTGAKDAYPEDIEFAFNEKLDINKIPNLGGDQITNKTARQGNLPFGVTDKQADWIIEHRAGNVQFQQLKSDEIKKLNDLLELREDIAEIRTLKESVNTGPVASRSEQAQRAVGLEENEYFNKLEIKSGKQLADFIKEISGAAVSEQEAQRLARLVPNVSMQDKQFINAIDDLEDGLSGVIQAKINQYDLESEERLTNAIRGGIGKEGGADEYPAGTIVEVNGQKYISNGDGTFNQQ
jgi:hypothetical protein